MDKIHLQALQFYGYHGLFKEETVLGQRFTVDLTLYLSLKEAGLSDEMSASIDYGAVYQVVKEILEGQPYKLIEAVAEATSAKLLNQFTRLQAVNIKLIKPDPPIPGHYHSVAVEIYREKQ